MEFLKNSYFLLALTFGIFACFHILQTTTKKVWLNPILATIILMIVILTVCQVSYNEYMEGGRYIDFFLKPAVVALALPLYRQLSTIRRQLLPILLSQLAGCIAGIISVILLAELFGATKEIAISLAAKSVTTPIAIEVTKAIGGIDSLTAAVVVCTGIFGSMAGFYILKLTGVKSPIAMGLSIGTASHAVGTAAAMDYGYRYGAFSSLGLTINGLFTALLTPYLLSIIGYTIQ